MFLQDKTVNTESVSTRYKVKKGVFLQDISVNTGSVTKRYNSK